MGHLHVNRWACWLALALTSVDVNAQQYPYFAPGGALSCTGSCTQQSVNVGAGSFITGQLPASNLAALTGGDCTTPGGSGVLTCSKLSSSTITVGTGSSTTITEKGPVSGNGGTLAFVAPNAVTSGTGGGISFTAGNGAGGNNGGPITFTAGTQTPGNTQNHINLNGGVYVTALGGGNTTTYNFQESGDMTITTNWLNPHWVFNGFATGSGENDVQIGNLTTGSSIGNLTGSATCPTQAGANFTGFSNTPSATCVWLDTFTAVAEIFGNNNTCNFWLDGNTNVVMGCVPTATSDTNGFLYIPAVAGVPTGTPANTSGAGYSFGTPIRYDTTDHRLYAYDTTWRNIGNPVLSNTSGSIGGGALLAGACTSGTTSVTGATTAMVVSVTPSTYPGDGIWWEGYVSSSNTVTVKVCAAVASTPTASTYNIRVLQ